MHKLTVTFAASACVLAIATGVVIAQMVGANDLAVEPAVQGTRLNLSIPTSSPSTDRDVHFDATSALLWDATHKRLLYEQNGFAQVPIASITKLMTAMVALDYGFPWDKPATIDLNEYGPGGNLWLQPGEHVTMRDLFNVSLLGSANNATLAYVRQLPVSREQFVQTMNRKAVALGLEHTYFQEVTGLNPKNVSTAYDVARLAEYAFANYPEIANSTRQAEYAFIISGSNRAHAIKNTNKLIQPEPGKFSGSKTGYLDEAKYCLVVQTDDNGQHTIAVILGSPSENQHFTDIQRLLSVLPH